MKLSVDGAICHALVDSGCSHCIVHAPYCASWTRKRADVMTMSGERQRCEAVGRVQLRVCNGDSVVVGVYMLLTLSHWALSLSLASTAYPHWAV